MRDSWLKLLDHVLRPSRPLLARSLAERERYAEDQERTARRRAAALKDCEARIEAARSEVFAAGTGVVGARMTELEREWRLLSRPDPDAGLMDLWARIAPSHWIDRKRWRDSPPEARLDAALALASDPEGVEEAERAVDELRDALAAWETPIGARIRWCLTADDFDGTARLLARPLEASREALAGRDGGRLAWGGLHALEREIQDAARARLPDRPVLAEAIAHAALVDGVLRATNAGKNPVTALRRLWKTGYVLASADASSVTIAIGS